MSTKISYGKKAKIELSVEEANLLYTCEKANSTNCPGGYFYHYKKVWWIIHDEHNHMPYTLCQSCYNNNKFGYDTIDIKPKLKPYLLQGYGCCCDGVKKEDAFPYVLNNFMNVGIYKVKPVVELLNGTIENKIITIPSNSEQIYYIICLTYTNNGKLNHLNSLRCKVYDNNNKEESVVLSIPSFDNVTNTYQIELVGIADQSTKSITPFVLNNGNDNKKIVVLLEDIIVSEFYINFINTDDKYDNEKNSDSILIIDI